MSHKQMTFKEHMESRAGMVQACEKATVGSDFAVFEFGSKADLDNAIKFAVQCNHLYKYTFESNLTDKFVCFDVK